MGRECIMVVVPSHFHPYRDVFHTVPSGWNWRIPYVIGADPRRDLSHKVRVVPSEKPACPATCTPCGGGGRSGETLTIVWV